MLSPYIVPDSYILNFCLTVTSNHTRSFSCSYCTNEGVEVQRRKGLAQSHTQQATKMLVKVFHSGRQLVGKCPLFMDMLGYWFGSEKYMLRHD